MSVSRRYTVLFLCTHNSARSVMAEAILNRIAGDRFIAHSAGSQPSGAINPYVRDLLATLKYPVDALRSKDWGEFAAPGAPHLDFVFTVCDKAAQEVCPVWPGQPMSAHWGFPDPSSFVGSEAEKRAFVADVFAQINRRLTIFASLPIRALDRLSLQRELDAIGHDSGQTDASAA